ncbi:hypothetical protein [Actinomadura formosensis]|uniref:hypothetical protein n=1 Tax=Actinomadura formosensis TaxID=60706 RepID=UPI003D8EC210
MISEELADFLSAWCNIDTDPEEVVELLHGPSRKHFLSWLPRDLEAAARSGALTPDGVAELTGLGFRSQAELDAWLRDRWAEWFDRPSPV